MTEYISAVTALVAVILSPFVSLFIARKQINTTVLSSNRQLWINTLRDQISELLSLFMLMNVGHKVKLIGREEFLQKLERSLLLEARIKLLINPKEEDHAELITLIRMAIEEIFRDTKESDLAQLRKVCESIISKSQTILKKEWERVKEGK